MIEVNKLLEVYTLEEILEALDLTPEDVLDILVDMRYFDGWQNPRPL